MFLFSAPWATYWSNSAKVFVSAACTEGQKPPPHFTALPLEPVLPMQYDAAEYSENSFICFRSSDETSVIAVSIYTSHYWTGSITSTSWHSSGQRCKGNHPKLTKLYHPGDVEDGRKE